MNKETVIVKKCLICKGKNLIPYLDLGKTPLANSYVNSKNLKKPVARYPLKVLFCQNCFLCQLDTIVDRSKIFDNYAYRSSDSPQLEKYFEEYATDLRKKFPKNTSGKILEIASNDGILLKRFKKFGAKILGVDSAKNIVKIANQKGIPTLALHFDSKVADLILKKHGTMDLIMANNVLAHTGDIDSMIAGIKKLLGQKGIFVFEVQYIANLIKNTEFDNTYHEHICYLGIHPLNTLLDKHNLEIFKIKETKAQGGSVRIFVRHKTNRKNTALKNMLKKERELGLHTLDVYKNFAKKVDEKVTNLYQALKKIKSSGKTIAGYGASAKSTTLLEYANIDNALIDFIVDDADTKINKHTPNKKLKILPSSELKKRKPDYILILAWNYADSIMAKESWFKKEGGKFIIPIPKIKII